MAGIIEWFLSVNWLSVMLALFFVAFALQIGLWLLSYFVKIE